jgi:hypothetical protein
MTEIRKVDKVVDEITVLVDWQLSHSHDKRDITVFPHDGLVHILEVNYTHEPTWVQLTPREAIDLGNRLLEVADRAERTKWID